jgi:hypothetical protein
MIDPLISSNSSTNGTFIWLFVRHILISDYQEEFEDIKGSIIIRILKKNRLYNGQKKKYKRTNNDLQYLQHTHKAKYRVIETSLKTGGELRCPGRVGGSCSTSFQPYKIQNL